MIRPNGITFIATPATTVFSNKWQLKPGDIVTFRFQGYWLGCQKPKSPSILRLRSDKTWEEVVASFHAHSLPSGTTFSFSFLLNLSHHWKYENCRDAKETNSSNTHPFKRVLETTREQTSVFD
jgi:hypothetical protein